MKVYKIPGYFLVINLIYWTLAAAFSVILLYEAIIFKSASLAIIGMITTIVFLIFIRTQLRMPIKATLDDSTVIFEGVISKSVINIADIKKIEIITIGTIVKLNIGWENRGLVSIKITYLDKVLVVNNWIKNIKEVFEELKKANPTIEIVESKIGG